MAFSTKSRQVADLNSNSISYTADGGVATTVESKLRESVSVKDFGATGDGVTDDTSAIQAAIDAVIVNGGDIIFPEGAYGIYGSGGDSLLNGLLLGWQGVYTEEPKIRLVGDGSAQLNCYTANTIMIRASRPSVEIHNLTINGRGLSQVWGVGLVAESRETIPATEVSQSYFKMFDCQVLNCTEGLVAEPAVTVSGADSGCFYPVISHSTFNLNTRAIWFKGCNATAMSLQSGSDLAQSQNNRVTRANILACRIERGNTGVDLEFATETTILGCNFQNMLAGTFGTSPHTNATGLYLGEPTENTNVFGGVAENCDYSIDNSAK